jgi:hypothetical protein
MMGPGGMGKYDDEFDWHQNDLDPAAVRRVIYSTVALIAALAMAALAIFWG